MREDKNIQICAGQHSLRQRHVNIWNYRCKIHLQYLNTLYLQVMNTQETRRIRTSVWKKIKEWCLLRSVSVWTATQTRLKHTPHTCGWCVHWQLVPANICTVCTLAVKGKVQTSKALHQSNVLHIQSLQICVNITLDMGIKQMAAI